MDKVRADLSALQENYEKIFKEKDAKEELMQKNVEVGELKQELIEFMQRLFVSCDFKLMICFNAYVHFFGIIIKT